MQKNSIPKIENKAKQQYSKDINPKIDEYFAGFTPRLVQSIKSQRIRSNETLEQWVKAWFNQTSPTLIVLSSQYETLCSLLTRRTTRDFQDVQYNAAALHIEHSITQVKSWLLATMNAGSVIGSPVVTEEQQLRFIVKFFLLALVDKGEKVLKYHLSYIFCRATDQMDLDNFVSRERPPEERGKDGVLFGGAFGTFVTRKLLLKKEHLGEKRAHAAYTLIQSKRAWNPISRKQQYEALLKHRKALCENRLLPFEEGLKFQVERTVFEIFGKGKRSRQCRRFNDRVPSISAHFQYSRTAGGAVKALAEKYYFPSEKDYEKPRLGGFSELIGFIHEPKVKEVRGYPRNDFVMSVEGAERHFLKTYQAIDFLWRDLFGSSFKGINGEWDRYYWDREEIRRENILGDRLVALVPPSSYLVYEAQLDTEVHIVLEPAKARIITAGPPVTYHRCRSFQKAIHSILRQHPTFRLIGGPLTEKEMNYFGEKLSVLRGSDSWFLSGDYSGATDNLHPELIRVCAEAITESMGFSVEDARLYKRSLYDHMIRYPDQEHPYGAELEEGECFDIPSGDQCWGQLMGSPSSFPVLCLINAAINRHFWEKNCNGGKKIPLKDCPMLINGDDILMTINPDCYQNWWEMVRSCGLEPSLGKNYLSKDFAMINSQLWLENRDCFGNHGFWKFVPFTNLGLLRGQSKVMSDTRKAKKIKILPGDLVANAQDLLRGFKGESREELYSLWLNLNRDPIDSVLLPKQNWFIPTYLGGLGLPLPEREVVITRGQGKLASFLLMNKKKVRIPSFEMFKPSYLKLEEHFTGFFKDLVEYQFWEEEDLDKYEDPFPSMTKYYESCYFEGAKTTLLEEESDEHKRMLRSWNLLWSVATSNRLDCLTDQQLRSLSKRKYLPKPKTKVIGTFLKSSVFDRTIEAVSSVL